MRLTAIRLAGFKSFVDVTTLTLTSNLSGVVGPNGCGKSNVIDAVRWVTGESSARQLRGEALEDVIFNGSRARKPVGRASVELRFDNSEGKLGGQYAGFGEISIKRELARDGASRYFINGARARRRDVIDLFLGTGLGGRSNYAVIEQGAVNRLVEARPEDMRQVLEEAAGISRYKERRRETENRIRHTRDNLDRLNDLIGEVEQRLTTLKRQSTNAEKYKRLKADERRLRAQLLALRWSAQAQDVEAVQRQLREREDALRAATSTQHAARSESERHAAAQQHAMTEVQTQQAAFYDAQAQATRIDQQLAHARELAAMHTRERQDLAERIDTIDARIVEDVRACDDTRAALEAAQAERTDAAAAVEQAGSALAAAEQRAGEAESAWDDDHSRGDNPAQALEGERTQLRYGQDRHEQLRTRRDERQREYAQLEEIDDNTLEAADERLDAQAETLADDESALHEAAERDRSLDEQIGDAENTVATLRDRLAQTRARLTSEQQLQQAALAADGDSVRAWLQAQGVTQIQAAAGTITVAREWRTAAEAALGDCLRGFVVPALPEQPADWPEQAVTLVEDRGAGEGIDASPAPAGSQCLADLIQGPESIRRLAANVFVVADLAQASALRARLSPGQRVVTRDGCRLGPSSLATPAAQTAQTGVLEREERISELADALDTEQQAFEDRRATLEHAGDRRAAVREERRTLEARIDAARRALETGRAKQQGQRLRAQQNQRRRAELDTEIAELDAQLEAVAADNARRAGRIDALVAEAERFVEARRQLRARVDDARGKRDAAREYAAARERALAEVDRQIDGLRSAEDSRGARLADARANRAELGQRLAAFDAEQPSAEAALPDEAERQAAIEARDHADSELRAARAALDDSEAAVQTAGEQLMAAEQEVEQAREALQQARIDVETADVRRAGVAEQLEALGESPQARVDELPGNADAATWADEIERVERQIQRLGAINLAAIEEYDAEAEREQYLNEQHRDLSEALATLEAAIARIDRETRARFKATYEQVNGRFAEMFPALFGGGDAALELTDHDWLATGVRVMARPPGKRNASIQMLSGGEKALTAVALLFALFELNPAPFCMLDEIDAPLDDANVSRFCDLLAEMSAHVQFIVITHNKLTMALAEQLHGVTMAEPGVSRLVSVDIEQALDMAG